LARNACYISEICGRARLSSDVSEIKLVFRIPPERPTPNFAASWNVAPSDPLPVVRYDPKDHQRSLEVMRWGLIPYWAKDDKIGFSTINARAEEVDIKPVFREPFRQRRCLVPVENFYEWKKTGKGKQPYAVGLKGGGLMALAGLWDTWRSPPANASAASRLSPRSRTNYAPGCTTACPWCLCPRSGRHGSARNRPIRRS
jgi:putative SOS response-associated peptidase YedK